LTLRAPFAFSLATTSSAKTVCWRQQTRFRAENYLQFPLLIAFQTVKMFLLRFSGKCCRLQRLAKYSQRCCIENACLEKKQRVERSSTARGKLVSAQFFASTLSDSLAPEQIAPSAPLIKIFEQKWRGRRIAGHYLHPNR